MFWRFIKNFSGLPCVGFLMKIINCLVYHSIAMQFLEPPGTCPRWYWGRWYLKGEKGVGWLVLLKRKGKRSEGRKGTGYSQAVCRATGQPVYGQGMFWGHYKITLVYWGEKEKQLCFQNNLLFWYKNPLITISSLPEYWWVKPIH